MRRRNDIARDLRTPKYQKRVVPAKTREDVRIKCSRCGEPLDRAACACQDATWTTEPREPDLLDD